MIKTAVIGHPVEHSLSPLIHEHWMTHYGLTGDYERIDIMPETLNAEVRELIRQGYAGFNVTIPHKESVIALCDYLDETARAIGAVNTVVVREDGSLEGRNTDAFGFVENIRQSQPDFDFTDGAALILGAGGAARAIAYALKAEGVPEVRVTNRTLEKAQTLAQEFGLEVIEWDERENVLDDLNLLVNTTSLGMSGQPALDINLEGLNKAALVCDIVYKPLYTDLLKAAQARHNPVVTGIGMLLNQARPAFKAWFGVMPDVTEPLEEIILEAAQ